MTEICSQCGSLPNEIHEILPGEWLCESCFNEYTMGPIRDPRSNPPLEFYGYSESGRFFGTELEMMDGRNPDLMAGRLNYALSEVFTKRDGSVPGGFEMVSQPCTLEYHESMDYTSLFSLCDRGGFKSHDASRSCGLHIHISRDGIPQKAIGAQLYLIHKFWDKYVKFSRRKREDITRWAGKYDRIDLSKEFTQIFHQCQNESLMGYQFRYRNINLQNDHTIEYRIFRGTLNRDTYIASIQFCELLSVLSLSLSEDEIRSLSWSDIKIRAGKYPELKAYMKKRGL